MPGAVVIIPTLEWLVEKDDAPIQHIHVPKMWRCRQSNRVWVILGQVPTIKYYSKVAFLVHSPGAIMFAEWSGHLSCWEL